MSLSPRIRPHDPALSGLAFSLLPSAPRASGLHLPSDPSTPLFERESVRYHFILLKAWFYTHVRVIEFFCGAMFPRALQLQSWLWVIPSAQFALSKATVFLR